MLSLLTLFSWAIKSSMSIAMSSMSYCCTYSMRRLRYLLSAPIRLALIIAAWTLHHMAKVRIVSSLHIMKPVDS